MNQLKLYKIHQVVNHRCRKMLYIVRGPNMFSVEATIASKVLKAYIINQSLMYNVFMLCKVQQACKAYAC